MTDKNPTDDLRSETDRLIKQFAVDFNIPMESYKYNEKRLIVTYHCVDASPSEVDRWGWQVPAFVIKMHYELFIAQLEQIQSEIHDIYAEDASDYAAQVHQLLTKKIEEYKLC